MKRAGDSQQVVDDYVEALLGDVLGATEPHRAPMAGAEVADRPDVSLAAAPVIAEPVDVATPVGAPCVATGTCDQARNQPTRMANTPDRVAPAFAAASASAASVTAIAPPIPATQRWLRVTVGGDSYALELLSVQEVVRMVPIVAMRGAGHAVLGVMNLRGRIVPVFDLGLWLGTGCVQPDERSRIVVVERHDELIGVLVSGVDDVVTLGRERIEPPLPGTPAGAILGIARVGPAPTVLLQAGALFA